MSVVASVNGVNREAPGMYAAVDGVLRAIAEPAPELTDLTADATATAANIEEGYTAYVKGVKLKGTKVIPKVQYEVVSFSYATAVTCTLGRITGIIGAITTIWASAYEKSDMETHGYILDAKIKTRKPNDDTEYNSACSFNGSDLTFGGLRLGGTIIFINDPSAVSLF